MLTRITFRFSLLLIFLFLTTFSLGAFLVSPPQASAESSLLFGQKQTYTAIVRTDKRVVTYAKIYLNNDDTGERTATSFTIPDGVKVSNLSAYQITLPERCKSTLHPSASTPETDEFIPSCSALEQQIFDLETYYSYYGQANSELIYKRIALHRQSGSTYTLTLPEPIAPQKRGAYLVSYIAEHGYVTGNFGLYNLTFRTLQVPESVQEVRVAIDTSEDLYTKAKRSGIATITENTLSQGSADAAGNLKSASLDRLVSTIGNGGTFTKTGKSLAPQESLVVNGEFADAAWKLNIKWIIGGIIGLIALTGLTVILMRKAQGKPILPQKGKRRGK